MQLERIEEWLSSQVEALRKTLSKAILGVVTAAIPLLLLASGLTTANKTLGTILWFSVVLNSLLLCVVCSHRIEIRRLKCDPPKTPELPELNGLDKSMLIYLVAQNLGCGVDRIATYAGKASYEIAHSMDKLEAHGYVQKTRDFTASGAEYKATPKGRDRCVNPKKYA